MYYVKIVNDQQCVVDTIRKTKYPTNNEIRRIFEEYDTPGRLHIDLEEYDTGRSLVSYTWAEVHHAGEEKMARKKLFSIRLEPETRSFLERYEKADDNEKSNVNLSAQLREDMQTFPETENRRTGSPKKPAAQGKGQGE